MAGVAPRRGLDAPATQTRAPTGDRLRAMEQLEWRALGRPTERIETDTGETPAQRMLR
jgi:hypothetical protein